MQRCQPTTATAAIIRQRGRRARSRVTVHHLRRVDQQMRRSMITIAPTTYIGRWNPCTCHRLTPTAEYHSSTHHQATPGNHNAPDSNQSSSSSPQQHSSTNPPTPLQKLSTLFTNLPKPWTLDQNSTNLSTPNASTPTTTNPVTSHSSTTSQMNSNVSPPSSSTAPSSTAPSTNSTAALLATKLIPNFLCFLPSTGTIPNSKGYPFMTTPITSETILNYTQQNGLDWCKQGSVSERHIAVVHAPPGTNFNDMAGFPSTTAFYIVFPRHETRSPARHKFIDDLTSDIKPTWACELVQKWGWRVIRYPYQLVINTHPKRVASTTIQKELGPSSILAVAQANQLPGWNRLQHFMITSKAPSSYLSWMSGPQPNFQIRVPPIPTFLDAMNDILASASLVKEKLGWTIDRPNQFQDVPVLTLVGTPAVATSKPSKATSSITSPTTTSSQLSSPSASGPSTTISTARSSVSPATITPSSFSSSFASASPTLPTSTTTLTGGRIDPFPTRFRFYSIDERGRVTLESSTAADLTSHISNTSLLNDIYRRLAPVESVTQQHGWTINPSASAATANGEQRFLVPIPKNDTVLSRQLLSDASNNLSFSSISSVYPFGYVTKGGDMYFFRASLAPIVFMRLINNPSITNATATTTSAPSSGLRPSTAASAQLIYGGDLMCRFQPDQLCVDSDGRFYHPTPFLQTSPIYQTKPIGTSPLTHQLNYGLISSKVTADFKIQSTPLTPEERTRIQELIRRFTIELQEQSVRVQESSTSNPFNGLTVDQWIKRGVSRKLSEVGLDAHSALFSITWEGQTHRIRSI